MVATMACPIWRRSLARDGRRAAHALRQLQLLGIALVVVANDRIGKGERPHRTAEIFAHHIGGRAIGCAKVEDKVRIRPAPLIDRLVVVAHHHIVAMGRSNQIEHQVLRQVDILKFVHHHAIITLLQLCEDRSGG